MLEPIAAYVRTTCLVIVGTLFHEFIFYFIYILVITMSSHVSPTALIF